MTAGVRSGARQRFQVADHLRQRIPQYSSHLASSTPISAWHLSTLPGGPALSRGDDSMDSVIGPSRVTSRTEARAVRSRPGRRAPAQ